MLCFYRFPRLLDNEELWKNLDHMIIKEYECTIYHLTSQAPVMIKHLLDKLMLEFNESECATWVLLAHCQNFAIAVA